MKCKRAYRNHLNVFPDSSEFSDWFVIDPTSGEVRTHARLDCELEERPRVILVATDHGSPRLSSTATLSVRIRDVNDFKPLFDQSFYQVSLPEDTPLGR